MPTVRVQVREASLKCIVTSNINRLKLKKGAQKWDAIGEFNRFQDWHCQHLFQLNFQIRQKYIHTCTHVHSQTRVTRFRDIRHGQMSCTLHDFNPLQQVVRLPSSDKERQTFGCVFNCVCV